MSLPREDDPPQVLDPRQLVRIQSVHKGFLYQHLRPKAFVMEHLLAQLDNAKGTAEDRKS